jgi:hypothetical protein
MSQFEESTLSKTVRSANWSGCVNAVVRFVHSAGCGMFRQSIAKSASKSSSVGLPYCVVGVWSIEMGDAMSVGKDVVVMAGRTAGKGADGGKTDTVGDK